MDRIVALEAILGSLAMGLLAAVLALVVRLVKGDGARSLWRSGEAFVLAFLGAFLARMFISIVLALGNDSDGAVLVTSLVFFIWPGAVNLVSVIFGAPIIGVDALLWTALVTGGLVGLFDGLWATQNWKGLGAPGFFLDVTWGLPGSLNGVLLHLINFAWAQHWDDEPGGYFDAMDRAARRKTRRGAHGYVSGFKLKDRFAFTQGAVMSDMTTHLPGGDLFKHESIHIWQSRLMGPFFWFSYFGWMVAFFIPGLIGGLIGRRPGPALEWWTYYNNPWEIMAYGLANPRDRDDRKMETSPGVWGDTPAWLCWPWVMAILMAVPGVILLLGLFLLIFIAGFS